MRTSHYPDGGASNALMSYFRVHGQPESYRVRMYMVGMPMGAAYAVVDDFGDLVGVRAA